MPTARPSFSHDAANRLWTLVSALGDHFGTGPAALSALILNDSRFFAEARRAAVGLTSFPFSSRRMDQALGHIAHIWPSDLAWPDHVARVDPLPFPEEKEPEVRHRLTKMLADKAAKEAGNGPDDQG
ncbi:hypothetical protein SAMN05444339_10249 [Loktanella atrilutea]|uniref:Uncharacterized protein n=1 Tax=Loktanella atrilutea TaxID=366533 RepID=A0A1M4WBE9_LOKAT|nr:hypothetical protein [Loktanella atrilutea]SHE78292.1 hypothetical protein SAMN05444339_10249 [Loktanella atrilutea]